MIKVCSFINFQDTSIVKAGAKWQYTVATHIADTIIPPLNNKYQRFHNDDRNFVPCNVINPVAIKVFKQLPDKGWPV